MINLLARYCKLKRNLKAIQQSSSLIYSSKGPFTQLVADHIVAGIDDY